MSSPERSSPELVRCRWCDQDKPATAFGVDNSRANRRNCYCKKCNRERSSEACGRRKVYPRFRRRKGMTMAERILSVLRDGPLSYFELMASLRLGKRAVDSFDHNLATLLLYDHEIRSEVNADGARVYLLPKKKIPQPVPAGAQELPNFSHIRLFHPVMRGERRVAQR
jgi:hypothetical protein